MGQGEARSTAGPASDLEARGRTLLEHLPTEAEECRRPATGGGLCRSRRFDQFGAFDQTPKILLVHVVPGNRLDRALQFGEGELRRHQFEDDGPVFDLAAQTGKRRRGDPTVVMAHRSPQGDTCLALLDAPVLHGFFDQTRLVEKLVALQHMFFVEGEVIETKSKSQP